MAKFVPNVLTADVLKRLDIPTDKLTADFPEMLKAGVDRLYALQREDGGWGWFDHDPVDPFMTAYAVLGLSEAKRLGIGVDGVRCSLGEKKVRALAKEEQDLNRLAYLCYAVSRGEPCAEVDRLVGAKEKLSPYALAATAIALHRWHRTEAAAFRKALADGVSGDHWETPNWYYKWENVDIETTALAIEAMLEAEPNHALLPKAIEWILSQREGDHWTSTKDTAAAIHAVLGFTLASKGKLDPLASAVERKGDGKKRPQLLKSVRARLGGASRDLLVDVNDPAASRFEAHFSGSDIAEGDLVFESPSDFEFDVETALRVTGVAEPPVSGVTLETSTDRPLGQLRIGDEVTVSVTLTAKSPCDFVMLESPIPAGCEVIRGSGTGGFARFEARYEEAIFFLRSIGSSPVTLTYKMRCGFVGSYTVASASAAVMYNEKIGGSAAPRSAVIRN